MSYTLPYLFNSSWTLLANAGVASGWYRTATLDPAGRAGTCVSGSLQMTTAPNWGTPVDPPIWDAINVAWITYRWSSRWFRDPLGNPMGAAPSIEDCGENPGGAGIVLVDPYEVRRLGYPRPSNYGGALITLEQRGLGRFWPWPVDNELPKGSWSLMVWDTLSNPDEWSAYDGETVYVPPAAPTELWSYLGGGVFTPAELDIKECWEAGPPSETATLETVSSRLAWVENSDSYTEGFYGTQWWLDESLNHQVRWKYWAPPGYQIEGGEAYILNTSFGGDAGGGGPPPSVPTPLESWGFPTTPPAWGIQNPLNWAGLWIPASPPLTHNDHTVYEGGGREPVTGEPLYAIYYIAEGDLGGRWGMNMRVGGYVFDEATPKWVSVVADEANGLFVFEAGPENSDGAGYYPRAVAMTWEVWDPPYGIHHLPRNVTLNPTVKYELDLSNIAKEYVGPAGPYDPVPEDPWGSFLDFFSAPWNYPTYITPGEITAYIPAFQYIGGAGANLHAVEHFTKVPLVADCNLFTLAGWSALLNGKPWGNRTTVAGSEAYNWANLCVDSSRQEWLYEDNGALSISRATGRNGPLAASVGLGAYSSPCGVLWHGSLYLTAYNGGSHYFLRREGADSHAQKTAPVLIGAGDDQAAGLCVLPLAWAVVAAVPHAGNVEIYLSTDQGATWALAYTKTGLRYPALCASPGDNRLWLVGYADAPQDGATGSAVVCGFRYDGGALTLLNTATVGGSDEGRSALWCKSTDWSLRVVAPKTTIWTAANATPGRAEYLSTDAGRTWEFQAVHGET